MAISVPARPYDFDLEPARGIGVDVARGPDRGDRFAAAQQDAAAFLRMRRTRLGEEAFDDIA